MKFKLIMLALIVLFAINVLAQKKKEKEDKSIEKKVELKSEKDKVSYIIGLDIGNNLKRNEIDVDLDLLTKGIKDMISGTNLLINQEDAQKIMTEFQQKLQNKQTEKQKVVGDKNKKEGEAFLVTNREKDSIIITKSGLQYKILKAGTGKIPKTTDTVVTHYRGTFIDGTEFDNSFKRGEPATFPVTGVIPGWTEALQLMPVGSKWQLFIPSNLAYGERGAGQVIGPNMTLIFEIELIAIK